MDEETRKRQKFISRKRMKLFNILVCLTLIYFLGSIILRKQKTNMKNPQVTFKEKNQVNPGSRLYLNPH